MLAAPATLLSAALLTHGAPPVATDVLAGGGSPTIVRLSRGLAVATPEGPRYVCPTRWGGPDSPPAVGMGSLAFVAGGRGLMSVADDGSVTAETAPVTLDGATTRALVADGARVFALSTGGDVVALRPNPAAVWATLAPAPDTIGLSNNSVVVAGAEQGTLRLWTLTAAGEPPEPRVLATSYDYTPTLQALPDGRIYVRGAGKAGFRLDRVGAEAEGGLIAVTASTSPIYGLVAAGGDTFVAVGGVLNRLDGDTPTALAGAGPLTCLRAAEGVGLIGCVAPDLIRIGPDGAGNDTLFAFSGLLPPSLDGLSAAEATSCQLDWYDVATESGFTGDQLIPPAWSASSGGDAGPSGGGPVDEPGASGCSSGSPRGGWAAACVAAFWALRRRLNSRRRC